jgi:hypothetical protein
MKAAIIAQVVSSVLAAPAYADRGRTDRGADADGDRVAQFGHNRIQEEETSRAAILILRALIEQLVQDGVLLPENALKILDRAKAISAAEGARQSRLRVGLTVCRSAMTVRLGQSQQEQVSQPAIMQPLRAEQQHRES